MQSHQHWWETMGADDSWAETVWVTIPHQTDDRHGLRNSGEGDVILIADAPTILQCDGFVK